MMRGHATTIGATMNMVIAHGQAVICGSACACVVANMLTGSYEVTVENADSCAQHIMRETGYDVIKLKNGAAIATQTAAVVLSDIPIMGHIALLL